MSTYDKLGGKTVAELPIPPTNVTATNDSPTEMTVTWQNNNTITGGTNVVQVWTDATATWTDDIEVASDATSGVTTGATEVSTYNVRVAVKLNDRYYPSLATSGAIIVNPFPLDNLVARWQFEDDLTDSYGSYTLTTNGDESYPAGKVGKAIFWTSSGLQITQADIRTVFDNLKPFSISFWAKQTANGTKNLMKNHNQSYVEFNTSIPGIRFYDRSGNGSNYSFTILNTWAHIVWTFDGDKHRIYVNSTLRITSASDAVDESAKNPFELMESMTNMNLDQVYVYSDVLTTDEIAQLYNSGSGI